jgi:hypothetical protein
VPEKLAEVSIPMAVALIVDGGRPPRADFGPIEKWVRSAAAIGFDPREKWVRPVARNGFDPHRGPPGSP